LGRIRLELLAIELQEEKERVFGLLFWTVLTALMVGFGIVMAVLLITVLFWDSYRLLALALATALLLGLALWGLLRLRRLSAQAPTLFQSSLMELRRDSAALRREPPP
jgi:uncharacterized membrane protein YqjE